jgi:hypothetical protein
MIKKKEISVRGNKPIKKMAKAELIYSKAVSVLS